MKRSKKKAVPNKERPELPIDENRLDSEWIKQPELYYKYAKALADAKKDLEKAKSRLDLVRAEVATDVRSNPASYGVEKVTEAAITNAVIQSEEVKEATANLVECRHTVDLIQAMVTALDHRKKALENLVALHGQNYFATPRAKTADVTNDEIESAATFRQRRKKGGVAK